MRKLKLFFACLLMAVLSIGQVWGDSYTITLKSSTGTSDSSSGMTSPTVADYVADGASYVSAVAPSGKVYLAKSDCGLKFGNSSGGGSLTFTLATAVKPTSIVVNASQFGASEGKGIFQGEEFDMTVGGGKYVFNNYTVEYDGNTSVTTISVGAEKRGYVKSITVNYGGSTPPPSCTNEITITKADDPANGTFALDNSGTVCIDEGNATVNVTATPADHYHLASVTTTGSVGTIGSIAGNTCEITDIDADTEIGVTFAEDTKYVVTWNVNGNEDTKTNVYADEKPVFPATPAACDATSTTFIGWATAPWTGKLDDLSEKTVYTSASAMPDVDAAVTYYAVFAKVSGTPSVTHTLTISGKTAASGYASRSETDDKDATWSGVYNYGDGTHIGLNKKSDNHYLGSPLFDANVTSVKATIKNGSSSTRSAYLRSNTETAQPSSGDLGSVSVPASDEQELTFTLGETAFKQFYVYVSDPLQFHEFIVTLEGSATYSDYMTTCAAPTCEDLGTPSVTVTNKTYNSAKLTWDAVDNADKYLVKFNGVDQEATENLYFDATGLEAEETYTYQVKALAEEGQDDYCDGAFSAEANFTTEPAPAATLTLSENTVTHNLAGDHTLGETVTLPSADDCSKKFRGWSTNENCETEPELHAGDFYTLNATSQTLYAVYAKVMSVSDPSLTKQVTGATFAAGEKLVIVAVVGDDNYALYQETINSSYVQNWAFDNNVATVAADAKKYVTLETGATSGKFYLGDATNGYVYSSGSNNLSVDASNKTEWTIVDNGDGTFKFNQGRYLSCRSELTSDKVNLYRLAGSTPAGTYSFDVYKYSAGDATYGEWSTTCTAALDAPTFSVNPAEGPFDHELSVELTAAEGDIYYNINSADDPTSGSTPYTGAITVDACGSTTIKAIAISSTNQSAVASATYVLNLLIPSVSAEDPYTEAEAVEVYNSGCYNNEDVWVTGTVQTAQFYSSNTYTITLTNGFQFYYFYESLDGENLVPFSSDYIVAGDVLVAAGKLSKHNTTYQIANGYLVSRTPAPKTPIDSDIDNPLSVAAAINYIDNAATYDLSEDEFVAGIVESIVECPQHEGTYDIIVLDATDNTKQIKFFGCDIKTFAGIKQYDQIIGKGKLFKYYSTYELNYPCEVAALTPYVAPVVDVIGVEVDETATVKVGKTVQLTANVLPANATNQNVTWSVKAGSEAYAEVSATGLVTGKAEGVATIVVTTEEGNFSDECTVTVTGGINFAAGDFVLVEDAAELTEGTYVIVAAAGYNYAMKYYAGSDNNHKDKEAIKEDKYLHYDSEFGVYQIKNYVVAEEVVGISFFNEDAENYFSLPGNSNQLKVSDEQNDNSSWTVAVSEGVTTLTNKAVTTRTLRYNTGSNCFASYATGQKDIALYKYVTPAAYRVYYNDNVAEEEIEVPAYQSVNGENKVTITTVEPVRDGYLFGGWKDGEANVYEAGVEYTLSADLTLYAQWTTATVSTLSYNPNGGTLIGGETAIAPADVAEGTNLTIEANVYEKGDNFVFAGWQLGDDVYQPGDPFVMPATDVEFVAKWDAVEVSDYALVTDLAQLQAGDKIIIVAADYNVAAGSQAATYRNPVTIGKTASKNNLILNELAMPTEFVLGIADGKFSFNDGDGYMYENGEKSVKVQDDPYYWTISIDGDAIATITGTNPLLYNSNNNQERFTTYTSVQKELQLYRKPGDAPSYTTVRENLNIGEYYTICLENVVSAVQGGSIWRVLSKAQNGNDVILEEAELPLEAGRPYIFSASADKLEVAYTGAAVDDPITTGNNGLIGSFTQKLIAQAATNYIIYNNALYFVNTDNVYVGAHRAYLDMTGVPAYNNEPQQGNAPRRRVTMTVYNEQTTTGIDELNASDTPVKMIINGQLFIIRGEKMFNANGQLVK